jgi:hypothetical protein
VGTTKPVTVLGVALSGADAGNYTVSQPSGLTANITAKNLTISGAVANNKEYDGGTSATVNFAGASLVGVIGLDVVSIESTGYSASFATKTVANTKPVTVLGVALSGADAGNYTVSQPSGLTANITARTLVVTAHASNKVYDGTKDASVTLSDDRVSGDLLTVSYTSALFSDKGVGDGKTVTVAGLSISAGADQGNYTLNRVTSVTTTANITALHITGSFTANNKVYDGNTSASVLTETPNGVISPDVVTLTGGTATFATKTVADGKTVTLTGASLSGADAPNYVLDSVATTTANITPRALTVTATGVNKVYDGGISATVNLSDNRVAGDVLTDGYTTASFADKNVGNGKAVSVSGISISGTDAGNYNLVNTTASTTANITPAPLSITANNKSKAYGDSLPALDATYTGFVGGEDKSVLTGTLVCSTTVLVLSPVGSYPDAITCSGQTSTNYNISYVKGTFTVTQATTTTAVTSSLNPSTFGMSVTFTATVSPQYSGVPTDTVTFKDGAATIGTGTLNGSGVATFTTSALTVGGHSITAVYGGDGNFTTSTSVPLTQNVQPYNFIGFLPPIDNLPIANLTKAGQTIPVKWQLKDVNGNLIPDVSTLASNGLQSGQIACSSSDPAATVEELSSPGSTVFRFDGTQFIFNWQTAKGWAGTCRMMQVTFADGSKYYAKFQLK